MATILRECFIIIDYNDKIVLKFYNSKNRDFLKLTTLNAVENYSNSFNHSYNRETGYSKTSDYNFIDMLLYYRRIYNLHERNVYTFMNNKWYSMTFNDNKFGALKLYKHKKPVDTEVVAAVG